MKRFAARNKWLYNAKTFRNAKPQNARKIRIATKKPITWKLNLRYQNLGTHNSLIENLSVWFWATHLNGTCPREVGYKLQSEITTKDIDRIKFFVINLCGHRRLCTLSYHRVVSWDLPCTADEHLRVYTYELGHSQPDTHFVHVHPAWYLHLLYLHGRIHVHGGILMHLLMTVQSDNM